ncbi:MAG: hypothetical protein C0631_15745 [Sedimenticola sp.]|uniref:TraK n=1 Tax=Sedimenticola thiotaurini TaxID=1543721 RepID=A0A558CX83_9GAMM|nr:MAG: hypothetical protein C0631_15745 [Sedimenticola sp.]TVT53379.1 MAG: hypothetical protein FHK82_12045 [Sedimenticola thiotaurini]TVT62217.1 MAG: hypothetical protein FHK78_15235 [Sedimenticola selenatireducens]
MNRAPKVKKTDLLEELRRTKSSNKSLIISRWPEIAAALEAGYTKKDVYELLQKQGLNVTYTHFTRFTKKLQNKGKQVEPEQSPKAGQVAAISKQRAKKPEQDGPITVGADQGEGFSYSPIPNEEELYGK